MTPIFISSVAALSCAHARIRALFSSAPEFVGICC